MDIKYNVVKLKDSSTEEIKDLIDHILTQNNLVRVQK